MGSVCFSKHWADPSSPNSINSSTIYKHINKTDAQFITTGDLESTTYLFIEINEQCVRKFQVLDREKHYVPVPVGDVRNEAVDAVHSVQGHGRLLLKHRQRPVQIILLQILHDQANDAVNVTHANE